MCRLRNSLFTRVAIAGAVVMCVNTGLLADEKSEASEDDDELIEEIVVRPYRPGDRFDFDAWYEERLRERLIKELDRMRVLDEKYEWRRSESDEENPSRIKWGYDPKAELRMRRDTKVSDLPIDDTKPATLFRFEF